MTGIREDTTRRLSDGTQIPMLGLGVWQVPDGPECVNAVRWALELGYRYIDTAQDMAALDALDETGGTDTAQEHKWW